MKKRIFALVLIVVIVITAIANVDVVHILLVEAPTIKGTNEILLANSSSELVILKHQNGEYEKIWTLEGVYVGNVKVGDVNDNGRNEFIIGTGGWTSEEKGMLFENISGTFVNTWNVTYTGNVYAVGIGDADNDGKNDNFVLGSRNHSFNIFKYVSGSYQSIFSDYIDHKIFDAVIFDADNDGFNEVLISNSGEFQTVVETVRVYENENGTFVNTFNLTVGHPIDWIGPGDMNGDGDMEFAVGGGGNFVHVYKYDGTKYEKIFMSEDTGNIMQSGDVGDIDGDEKDEIVAGQWKKALIYENQNGTFVNTYNLSFTCSFPMHALTIGDVDNNKMEEVVMACNGNVSIYKYTGVGDPPYEIIWTDRSYSGRNTVGDVDNDGWAGPTPTPTPSPTPTITPTPAPTPSPSPTVTPTPIPTPLPTPTSTLTPSPSPTPTLSPTPTPLITPSPTPIPSPTPTPAPSPSPTLVTTPSPTPTPTTTSTPSPILTPTPSPTPKPKSTWYEQYRLWIVVIVLTGIAVAVYLYNRRR